MLSPHNTLSQASSARDPTTPCHNQHCAPSSSISSLIPIVFHTENPPVQPSRCLRFSSPLSTWRKETKETQPEQQKREALHANIMRFPIVYFAFLMLFPSFPPSYPSMLLRKAKYTALLLFGKNAGRNMQLMTSKVEGTSHSQILG
jgi:hypothetical protein